MTEITTSDQIAAAEDADSLTNDHMAHLPGVDHDWARQFIEYDQKFHHFYDATEFFWVTPRVVKIGILKPDAIIGLLRMQHQEYCEKANREQSFEESMSMHWEAWMKPMNTSLPIWDLKRGLKCYLNGMSPMQAVQDIHADSEDGHENDSVGGGTTLLEPIMVIAIFAMLVIGIITFCTSSRDARVHAAEGEASRNQVTLISGSHH